MTPAWHTQSHTTKNLHQELDQEMRRYGPSTELLGEPLMTLSPPPTFLTVPGEQAMSWDSWQKFRFKQRAQRPGESVEQFVSALQELVKPCNFGDLEDQFILDQLIEKTSCMQLRERMLLGLDTLTLANALIIGKQLEYALAESTSASIENVIQEPEGAAYVDNEDLPVKRGTRGVRPRRSERLSKLKTHETGAPSKLSGHNKNDETSDMEDEACDANDPDYNGDSNTEDDARSKTSKKEHFCPICIDRSFSKPGHLARHMGTHTKEKPFTCPVCAKTFSQSYHMHRHLRNVHFDYCNKKDKNDVDTGEIEDQDNAFNNEDYDGGADNDIDSFVASSGSDEEVANSKTPDMEDEACDANDTDYNGVGNAEDDARSKTFKKEHFCPICTDRSFSAPSKLALHMRIHTKEKPYSCPVCAKTFSRCYHMNRHLRTQHYECNVLKGKCYQGSRNQHYDSNVGKDNDYKVGGNEAGEYCNTSDLDYDGSGNKEVDSSNIPVIKEEDSDDGGNKVGSCKTQKENSCPICIDRSFSKPSHLVRHMGTHTKEKPFPCPVCAKTFSQSYHMQRHLRNLHFDYCNKKDKSDVDSGEIEDQDNDLNDEYYDGGADNDVDSFVASSGSDEEIANSKIPDMEDEACDANDEDCDGDGNTDDIASSKTHKKAHICPICIDRSFSRPSHLVRHMGTHTKEKPSTCPVCAKTFSQSYHMTRHALKKHGQYICSMCGEGLGSWAEMKTHKMTHAAKEFSCPDCDNKFSGRIALVNHRKTHSTVRPDFRRLTCTVCGERFSTMYQLKRHLAIHDISTKSIGLYQCLDCQKSYTHFKDLKKHQELHCKKKSNTDVNKKSLLCGICGKQFTYEHALKNHERRHNEPFYCCKCDKHFSGLSRYKKHQEFHARKENLKCPHCKWVSRQIRHFKSHLRTHIKERPHQCSCCVESFTQREDLELHCLTHRKLRKERPYSCTRCAYAFSSLSELTAHMSLHEGEKPMNCTECGKTFLNKGKLEKHLTMHTAERPHLCSICGSRFLKSASLKVHMCTHTGVKPYKCSHCSKSFTNAWGLKNHSRHHMAVLTRYPCPDCGKTYGRKTELKKHQRSHTGDKPYACTCCNKRFLTQDKRSVHMRTHTGERPYCCSQCGKTFTQVGDRNRHIRKCH